MVDAICAIDVCDGSNSSSSSSSGADISATGVFEKGPIIVFNVVFE